MILIKIKNKFSKIFNVIKESDIARIFEHSELYYIYSNISKDYIRNEYGQEYFFNSERKACDFCKDILDRVNKFISIRQQEGVSKRNIIREIRTRGMFFSYDSENSKKYNDRPQQ